MLKYREIEKIKKTVYSYLYSQKNTSIRKQIRLKKQLSVLKIEVNTLEKDITANLHSYISLNEDLSLIKNPNKTKDLKYGIENDIKIYLAKSKKSIEDLNTFFEDIHSIYVLKLNYNLQIFAIIISIIGIVITFINFSQILKFLALIF